MQNFQNMMGVFLEKEVVDPYTHNFFIDEMVTADIEKLNEETKIEKELAQYELPE